MKIDRKEKQNINLSIIKPQQSKKIKTKEYNLKVITIITTIFIILLLLFTGYTFAKNIGDTIINTKGEIAEPIFIIENNPIIDITATENYGNYSFKIKNYDDKGKLSEVDMQYYIEILSNLDETIGYKIYENEKEIKLENNKTNLLKILKDSKNEKSYRIEFSYNKDSSLKMEDIIQKVQIKVHSEQVKG